MIRERLRIVFYAALLMCCVLPIIAGTFGVDPFVSLIPLGVWFAGVASISIAGLLAKVLGLGSRRTRGRR